MLIPAADDPCRLRVRRMLRIVVFALSFGLLIGPFASPQAPVQGEEASRAVKARSEAEIVHSPTTLPGVDGRPVALTAPEGGRGLVLVFLSPECPISNGYSTLLNALADEGRRLGVPLVGVHSNDGFDRKALDEHRREYRLGFPVVVDEQARLAMRLKVEACPTACVFDAQGRLMYHGRIDDRYVRRGGAPNEAKSNDLKNAVKAVAEGRTPEVRETKPLGCRIVQAEQKTAAAGEVTYAGHVADVLKRRCQECHCDGGVGPFALTRYDQAVQWADDLVAFTASGAMPPWKPAPGHGEFLHERRMTEGEIDLLADWVEAGCPPGDLAKAPEPFRPKVGWQLGEPDLVLQMPEPYAVAADGLDEYRCFVLPTAFDGDRYISAMEVAPGNPKVVHHVIAFLDAQGHSERLDADDPAPGYATSNGFPGFLPSGGLGGWAPGNQADFLPKGMAKVLPQGARVVLQVHYHRTGKPEVDQTKIGLYFAKDPVERVVRAVAVMPFGGPLSGMAIPAGDSNYEVQASTKLRRDVLVVGVTPHMHLIGKDMKLTAVLPSGETRPLLWVRDWDFNWQESYRYREPFVLPEGTRIELSAHFDNSAANPSNPNSPPKTVRWGEQTADEMCIGFLETAPKEAAKSAADLKPPPPGAGFAAAVREEVELRLPALRDRLLERFSPSGRP